MPRKTNEQYQEEERCRQVTETEREVSNKSYSFKWVEKGALWVLALIGAALVAAWVRLILK